MAIPLQIEFTTLLNNWYSQSNRPMPWKGIKDPYLIWISEVILQQTRVEQGWNYYLKFRDRFPNVFSLAEANEDEVLKYWEGLGYYSRARNLHFTAKYIVDQYQGIFPNKYEDILSLKGVGNYTAAAISSFAFSGHHAVVDGNVIRVLSRVFNIKEPFDNASGKRVFVEQAYDCINQVEDPGLYNQAIMDFGATICKPSNPECKSCLLNTICLAYQNDTVRVLPIKQKSLKRRTRYFQFFIIKKGPYLYIEQRKEKDIWKHLYQFPYLETEGLQEPDAFKIVQNRMHILSTSNSMINYKQQLTHQNIIASFCEVNVKEEWIASSKDWIKIKADDITKYALPRIINDYLENRQISLSIR